ncbi:hypothetical protein R1flu_022446 [Riccia fluitans]|uniref:Uncharacterized protein n=1 Tax=Riccia fluitans TaxID=41844 RepID=A0ABD1XPQ8_9MARC
MKEGDLTYVSASPREAGPETGDWQIHPIGNPASSPSANFRLSVNSQSATILPYDPKSPICSIGKSKRGRWTVVEGSARSNVLIATHQIPAEAEKPNHNRIDNISPEIGLDMEVILPTETATPAPHLLQISTSADKTNCPPDPSNEKGIGMRESRLLCLDLMEFGPGLIDPEIGQGTIATRSTSIASDPFSKTPPYYTANDPTLTGSPEMAMETEEPNQPPHPSQEARLNERVISSTSHATPTSFPARRTLMKDHGSNRTAVSTRVDVSRERKPIRQSSGSASLSLLLVGIATRPPLTLSGLLSGLPGSRAVWAGRTTLTKRHSMPLLS